MSIRKKIVISLSVVFSMLVALVIGIANMPTRTNNTSSLAPSISMGNGIDIIKGNSSIRFEYDPSVDAEANLTKVYEYAFRNIMAEPMVVNLQSINLSDGVNADNVTFTYAYSNSKVTNTDTLTPAENFTAQQMESKGTTGANKYIYIFATVANTDEATSVVADVIWDYGYPTTITINDGTKTTTKLAVYNAPINEPALPELEDGYEFSGWYLDEECTIPAEFPLNGGNNTQLYAKVEKPYPTATLTDSSWFQFNGTDGYTVIKGSSGFPSDGVVVIPKTYNDGNNGEYPVTAIADGTSTSTSVFYAQRSTLTSVTIPSTITSIGNYAFYTCSKITSITIWEDSQLTSIGEYAFQTCSGLTSITIPEGVTSIGYYAFYYCSGLTSITIPSGVTSIGNNAFNNCTGLTSVEFGSNIHLPTIGDSIFDFCSGLTSITIPEGVTSIGNRAFYKCSKLTSITIPASVTSIGENAFSSCSGLTSITIPEGVTSIGNGAFSSCSKLTSIVVESGNTVYDSRDNCNAIIKTSTNELVVGCKSTVIPNSVTSIGDYAFSGCSGLTSITIPASVTSIGYYAFYSCSGLTSITIPSSVTSIGGYAFYNCSKITSITIWEDSQLTSIGDYAFSSCSDLTSITIPEGVTSIGNNAFSGCRGLTSITIPSSVTSIGSSAFSGCSGLTSIEFGTNSQLTSIGSQAFSSCSKLTSITIPASVTSIGDYAFSRCSGLTSITIPASVTKIGRYAFQGCTGLTATGSAGIIFEAPSTWYRTSRNTYSAGTQTDVTSATQNATWMVSTSGYYNYYWYKK